MKIKWYKSGKLHKEEILDIPADKYIIKKEVINTFSEYISFYFLFDQNNNKLCDIGPLKFKDSEYKGKIDSVSDRDIQLIKTGIVLIDLDHTRVQWSDLIKVISKNDITFE